jgi:two-component system sensor histidine kinase DesK
MTPLGRWWRSRSTTERFDVSTRLSMYLILGLPLLIASSAVSTTEPGQEVRDGVAVALFLIAVAHIAACSLVVRASLERFLGRPARLGPPLVAATVLTVAGAVAGALVLTGPGEPGDLPAGAVLALTFAGMLAASVSPLLSATAIAGVVAGFVAVTAVVMAVLGGTAAAVQGGAFAAIWIGFMTSTYKFSAWMIGVVWELDRGRATAARLAVAEERLRFARDLHDVLGRNLSAIAVKSELAGRLAERGEDGAAAEMVEVRRIAHDSLREVRDVVRGYRTADLDAELAGARSVLRSAGVECRVIGDGARLPEPVQAALGWVVREATTNVIRHSDATTCTIGLDVRAGGGAATAVLRMENDRAHPANPDAGGSSGGSGLAGLSERLAGVGGRLEAGPRRGDRFVVEASVPVVDR